MLEHIASEMTHTGMPCSFGKMSRRKSTPSGDPSSRHEATAYGGVYVINAFRTAVGVLADSTVPKFAIYTLPFASTQPSSGR
jgi:hypothetical protein